MNLLYSSLYTTFDFFKTDSFFDNFFDTYNNLENSELLIDPCFSINYNFIALTTGS